MKNEKDVSKQIRKQALRKNWNLFKRSKLGMIGLYIVIFFFILSILQPILFATGIWSKGIYDPVVGYSEQFQEFLRMVTMCIADLMEEELETSSLKGLISFDSTLGIKLGPRSPTSYLGLLYKLAQMKSSYKEKSLSIDGGVRSFIDALFKSAEDNGVEFVFNGKVSSVIISDSVATGVKLENGMEYSAKTIVSSISPVNTFLDLVGPKNIETDLLRRIQALRCSGNASKLNIIFGIIL